MRIKFLKDAYYPQVDPKTNKLDPVWTKTYKAGETYEVSADHGNRWIRRNAAEEIGPEPKAAKETLVPKESAKA